MHSMTHEEFIAALKAQGVPNGMHAAFKCPMCGTIQSAADLMMAIDKRCSVPPGSTTFEDVRRYIGYSCVGRFTGQKFTRECKGAGRGCDWTLGGLFKLHTLEVYKDGEAHPHFELATPEEAVAHYIEIQKQQTSPSNS